MSDGARPVAGRRKGEVYLRADSKPKVPFRGRVSALDSVLLTTLIIERRLQGKSLR